MHPRTAVRREIAEYLRTVAPEAVVQHASVRDIGSLTRDVISLEVAEESIDQIDSGEGRRDRPARRVMDLILVIHAARPGNGDASIDAADDLSRRIEVSLNGYSSALSLVSSASTVIQAEMPVGLVTMQYVVEPEELDSMSTAAQEI